MSKIIFIDHASGGKEGFYVDKYIRILNSDNYLFYVCENFNKTNLPNVKKFFYKFVKTSNNKFFKVLRLIELYLELSYLVIATQIKYKKVHIVVNIYESFNVFKFLPKLLFNANKISAIIHDAERLSNKYPEMLQSDYEKYLFRYESLIVHNQFSYNLLNKYNSNISVVPFPVENRNAIEIVHNSHIKFLFLGHIRKEKGVDILLDTWREIQHIYNNIHLTVAGSVPDQANLNLNGLDDTKIDLRLGYVSEEEYNKLLLETDYIILPYKKGTNSGILSNAFSFRLPAITSPLPMFIESKMVLEKFIMRDISSNALKLIMIREIESRDLMYSKLADEMNNLYLKYQDDYEKMIMKRFSEIDDFT